MNSSPPREIPPLDDVATQPPPKNLEVTLDEVGLENVQTQIRWQGSLLTAQASAGVSLVDRQARGIHMSRLFRILSELNREDLTWTWLERCLQAMLESQKKLSNAGQLSVSFAWLVQRPALLSETSGWRAYPVEFKVTQSPKQVKFYKFSTKVLYSSTCPCSAGLSRQAQLEAFRAKFQNSQVQTREVLEWLATSESLVAVPHAQRSEAHCEFTLDPAHAPDPLSLIDSVEQALGTAVQASVKRVDEQEFARRNAQNLMFCEDAARKLKAAFLKRQDVPDFHFEVRHFESLHAHDVVAKVSKND